MVSLPLSFL
uniref:Uncharacterized protein n=1 Tax=Arundo donax TaxID=35708 RepID=A0A0A9AA47_ARUDO